MNTIKKSILFVGMLSVISGIAQNKFLDRTYWKANPSIAQIEKDIAEGNDVTELNPFAFDAVAYAFLEKVDNVTMKHLLSKEGNGVNKMTHDGRTYIFWAAYKSNVEMMKYLVANGAKTDIIDDHGNSVMNFAANTGQTNPELYDFLLANGADLKNEKSLTGANSLLLVAPYIKDFEIVDYFIDKGLSLNDIDDKGNGIFNYASKGGNMEILKELIVRGADYKTLNKEGGNAFIMASQATRGRQNTLEFFQFLEGLGLEPNIVEKNGTTPLHSIASNGKDSNVFTYFLEKGVDVNQQNEDGVNPFMNAAGRNNLEVVELMANKVTDFNLADTEGQTALAKAVQRNKPEVVKFLIEKGSKTDLLDKKGNSLAYYLAQSFSPKNINDFKTKLAMLSEQGVSVSATQHDGNTLYHLAAMKGNLALLKQLQTFGIEVNAKNDEGNTALHLAAMSAKDDAILKYLLEQGADKTALTDFEESVYDLAMENELLQANGIALEFLK